MQAIADAISASTSAEWRAMRNGGVADLLLARAAKAQDARLMRSGPNQMSKRAASTIEIEDVLLGCAVPCTLYRLLRLYPVPPFEPDRNPEP